jgi:TolA-binding protein
MAKINFLKAFNYPGLGHNAHFYLGKILGEEQNYSEAIKHLEQYVSKTTYEQGKIDALQLIEQYKGKGKLSTKKTTKLDTTGDATRLEETFSVQNALPEEKYLPLEVRIDSLLSMLTVDTLTNAGQKLLDGIKAFKNGNYDKAIIEFKRVLAENPSGAISVPCIYNIGLCYFKLRLFKDADKQFQQILDRYPSHSVSGQSLFLSALTYLELHE